MLLMMQQHKFVFLLTALLSTFCLNLFPVAETGNSITVLLQIAADVNLLHRRWQMTGLSILRIILLLRSGYTTQPSQYYYITVLICYSLFFSQLLSSGRLFSPLALILKLYAQPCADFYSSDIWDSFYLWRIIRRALFVVFPKKGY